MQISRPKTLGTINEIGWKRIFCPILCLFYCLLIFPAIVFSEEQPQNDNKSTTTTSSDTSNVTQSNKSNKSDKTNLVPPSNGKPKPKTISIKASKGKVSWWTEKNLGKAHGGAIVKYEDVTLIADDIWADMDAEVIEASGNVSLQSKDQILMAKHLIFDLKTKKGVLKDGLSIDTPWFYYGKSMSRLSEKDSLIEGGMMTSCSLDHPHYSFEASSIVIHLGKDLVAKNVVFRVGGVPLMYLPVYRRSLEKDKRAKFIFKIGSNTFDGYYVYNIVPIRWKLINGSVFFNLTSRRGTSGGTKFNYDADRMRMREIFLPVPKDAPYTEWQKTKDQMGEIQKRAQGELDKIWLKQIFIKFKVTDADKKKALEITQKVLKECQAQNADFAQLARRWSDDRETKSDGGLLGNYKLDEQGKWQRVKEENQLADIIEKGIPSRYIPLLESASKLAVSAISDIIETDDGYHILKLDSKDNGAIKVRDIFIMFDSSELSQKEAQDKANEILTKLIEGVSFEDSAKFYSDDKKKDEGGDVGWKVFQDLDLSFRNTIRTLNKGETSRLIVSDNGVYILKIADKEKTPSFAELAQKYSKSESAEKGGDLGFKNKWQLTPEIAKQTSRLELYNISSPIRSDDGYRLIRIDKKTRFGGDANIRIGDLYSYQFDKNPTKLGQSWAVQLNHSQTLWRSGDILETVETDTQTLQERLRMQKSLNMMARLSLSGKEYKQVYQSYTPERQLQSYVGFDYYFMTKTGSSGHSRFIIDGTRDLLGLDTNVQQKYPELSYDSPSYYVEDIQPFKSINRKLHSISERIQGKANFADMARKYSDDDGTKAKGGDLGWLNKQASGLNTKVESEILEDQSNLNAGDISEPISTSDGYYIVKIDEVKEEFGKRLRVKAKMIFIEIKEGKRTKDEASKLADEIYRKLSEGKRPSLGFITLNDTSFSYSAEAGNYFRDNYPVTLEKNIWLQSANANVSLGKRSIIKLGVTRELNWSVNGNYQQVWNSKTRPLLDYEIEKEWIGKPVGYQEKNAISNVYNIQTSLNTDLHRVFFPTFIPKIFAIRHAFNPVISFDYSPPGTADTDIVSKSLPLYPFGASAYAYERKQLNFRMSNTIEIKTKLKREKIRLFSWDLYSGIDFTEPLDSDRRYNDLRNTFTLKPSERIDFTTNLDFDPNNYKTQKGPLLSVFSNSVRYYDSNGKWSSYLNRHYIYYAYGEYWQQLFDFNIDLRWSPIWSLNFGFGYEYDKKVKDINEISIQLRRSLHCWDSVIAFSRRGTKGGYLTKDFTFSIAITADPGKSLGVGYDDVSKSWSLRSLPGMGRFGSYIGGNRYMGY